MRLLAWLLPLIILSGCGWHLRGVTPFPAEYRVLYLESQAGVNFDRQIKMQLEFNNVLLTERANDALAVLSIKELDIEKRTLSLTSNGQIAEFELNGRLTATLKRNDRDAEVVLEVQGRRRVSNDINNVLGTAAAEKQQRSELDKNLANKLMLRLQRLKYDQESQPLAENEE